MKASFALAILSLASFAFSTQAQADNTWLEKGFSDILNSHIITATRRPKNISNVPGAVSVYTSDDIERMGLRSLKEVLERTTGFFVNRQLNGATVGSRGFMADTDQFLLLIDGHNTNSIIDKGMGDQFLLPNLHHVKRIEIIRGPGSTLWGSDASLGIIHIITKTGEDLDGIKVAGSTSDADRLTSFNVQAGGEFGENIHAYASLTAMSSQGFEPRGFKDQDFEGLVGQWDQIEDSYEFYFNASIKNFTVKARALESNISRPFNEALRFDSFPDEGNKAYTTRSHYYIDASYSKALSDSNNLETRFFFDSLERIQLLQSPLFNSSITYAEESESSQETAIGIEIIDRWEIIPSLNFLTGLRYVETKVSPWEVKNIYPVSASATTQAPLSAKLVIPDEKDINQAFFTEVDWSSPNNTFNIIAGFRLDDNNLRENKTIFLPRFAFNYKFMPHWQLKYAYNTGYIRPSVGTGFLGQQQFNPDYITNALFQTSTPIRGATQSQEIQTHDIQLMYLDNTYKANLNFYHNTIEKPYQVLFEEQNVNGEDITVFYTNVNDVKTYGFELELEAQVARGVQVYTSLAKVLSAKIDDLQGSTDGFNYDLNAPLVNPFDPTDFRPSFGQGTYLPDGTMQGFPHLIVHAGINWEIIPSLFSNIHLRYWDELELRDNSRSTFDKTYKLDPELYFDYNIQYKDIQNTGIDLSLFIKNVFDNRGETSMTLYNNGWLEQGRRIGINASVQF